MLRDTGVDRALANLESDIGKILQKTHNRPTVEQKTLDADEQCCVCYETMYPSDNLAYCKFSCGRNLHVECMERWVKHK